jgi:hypothetical protein
MRTLSTVLPVLLVVLSCSKTPKEVPDASVPAPPPAAKEEPKDAPSAEGLKKISEALAQTCAAEFARAAKDKLQPGPAQACELGPNPELLYTGASTKASLDEVAEAMKGTCAELQKQVDAAVEKAKASNTAKTRDADAEFALKQYERTWVVAVVAPKHPANALKGDGYLYRVGSGKLECAVKVDVKGAELDKLVTAAVVKNPKLALQAGKAAAPAKGAKPAKKKGKK